MSYKRPWRKQNCCTSLGCNGAVSSRNDHMGLGVTIKQSLQLVVIACVTGRRLITNTSRQRSLIPQVVTNKTFRTASQDDVLLIADFKDSFVLNPSNIFLRPEFSTNSGKVLINLLSVASLPTGTKYVPSENIFRTSGRASPMSAVVLPTLPIPETPTAAVTWAWTFWVSCAERSTLSRTLNFNCPSMISQALKFKNTGTRSAGIEEKSG